METKKNVCCICGKEFEGAGNNPAPLYAGSSETVCCEWCDRNIVWKVREFVSVKLKEKDSE